MLRTFSFSLLFMNSIDEAVDPALTKSGAENLASTNLNSDNEFVESDEGTLEEVGFISSCFAYNLSLVRDV